MAWILSPKLKQRRSCLLRGSFFLEKGSWCDGLIRGLLASCYWQPKNIFLRSIFWSTGRSVSFWAFSMVPIAPADGNPSIAHLQYCICSAILRSVQAGLSFVVDFPTHDRWGTKFRLRGLWPLWSAYFHHHPFVNIE